MEVLTVARGGRAKGAGMVAVEAGLPEHARNAGDVVDAVPEEDQVHGRSVREVVLVVGILQLL